MSLALYCRPVIRERLPCLSFEGRAVLDALLLQEGSIGGAKEVAQRLGLPNRFRLAQLLRANGLPPLHRLSAWIMTLAWIWRWESCRIPLSESALRMRKEPSAASRLVKRLTGESWTDVRAYGADWMLARLLDECGDVNRQRFRRKKSGEVVLAALKRQA